MSTENKAANKVTEVKGKVKQAAGQATDNPDLEAEGKADEAKGNVKQAGEKIKDAFKD
ncbi:MAG TPA: CsbD family protein [Streptosporangiaceae bacterium]